MTVIPPRLSRILTLLLEADKPLSVDTLARQVGSSRRTIFRELEHVDAVLQKTGLVLDTRIGEGMLLNGLPESRTALLGILSSGHATPQNRQDRQTLLAFLLMDAGEMQKLYYYAKLLDVSEATISLDMDALEARLALFGLSIVRRQGQGAALCGSEESIRRMMVDCIVGLPQPDAFMKQYGHPSRLVFGGVSALLREEWLPNLDWMTEESLDMLETQLSILVERVQKHRLLLLGQETLTGLPRQLAGQLCDALESRFGISLPPSERTAVGVMVRACRSKQLNPLDINDTAAYNHVQTLAYRMIDSFDPTLSHSLKLNEDLVQGLSLHLWSAIARLKKGLELASPIGEQIQRDFPEVFEKSKRAARVLTQELEIAVPESEVAFIASHFGAALMYLGERSSRHVRLKAGIVCVAGIGVSYMMASQVRQMFHGKLEVVVSDWNSPEEWDEYDLLISSIPLDYTGCPVVVVSPILVPRDHEHIRLAIQNHVIKQTEEMPKLLGSLPDRLEKAARRFHETAQLLIDFSKLSIHADCTFDELAKMTGYRFGSQPESGNCIYEDLLKREAVSTQVIPQLGIVLLHSRTAGVSQPIVGLVSPENGQFTDPYFCGARGGLVMLVPRQSNRDISEVVGYISGALVEDDVLLGAVLRGDEVVAYTRIEAALLGYLRNYWSGHLDE